MLVDTSVPSTSKNAPRSQLFSLTAAAEEPQQEEEQVDEVEVERERADQRVALLASLAQRAQPLRVVGGEAGEDEHAAAGDDELGRAGAEEEIDDAREDDADEPDHEEAAHPRQVALGHGRVEREAEEGAAGDEERRGDGGGGIGEQVDGEGHARE